MRSAGVVNVAVPASSLAGSVEVPAGVVLFFGLLVGSPVLLSPAGSVVDVLVVVEPRVILRSAGVVNVVALVSSAAGSVELPTGVVLFFALLVGSTVPVNPAGPVVDVL